MTSNTLILPELISVEPGRSKHARLSDRWLPPGVYQELGNSKKYPVGAYALYRFLWQMAHARIGELDFRALTRKWSARPNDSESVPCLRSILVVAVSAEALADNEFLMREPTERGEHWTVLTRPCHFAF